MMRISVKVIVRAKSDSVEIKHGFFVVRTKSIPTDGKANDAVCAILAAHLKVTKSQVRIVRGHRSRNKIVDVPL